MICKVKCLVFCICLLALNAKAQEYFKTFDHINIAYSDTGTGLPVILIHGFISSGASWNNSILKQELQKKGFRVIVPDLRGNGESDQPQDAQSYANDAEIKDLRALADHLKLEKYYAVGYSRGAIVLAKLLTSEPRINKAVLGGMGLDFTIADWSRRLMFQKAFSGEEEPNAVTEGAIDYAKSIGADLKILSYLQEFQPVTSKEALQKIRSDVLVIAGDMDKDNGDPKELTQQIPGAILKIVPGSHNETKNTEAFSEEVMSFLMK